MRSFAFASILVVTAIFGACTTSNAANGRPSRTVGLSLHEATAIVDAFESKQVPPQKKPPPPTTLEEALAVLKSDRLDLFPASVAWLSTQPSPDAIALKAQTLLAWGEAELTVAEVLANTANALDEDVRGLQLRQLAGPDLDNLEAERAKVQLYRDTDQALRLLAAEHVAAGVDDARKYVAQKPDDYVGYRIAADAARLRNQWKEFADNVDKVEEKNPDSNGLVFLRGVAAEMRDGDARHASEYFKQALEKDPHFVRAQAELVLIQTNVLEQKKELDKLRALEPDHQIVRWAGPGIDDAYQQAVARQDAVQRALDVPRGPVPKAP